MPWISSIPPVLSIRLASETPDAPPKFVYCSNSCAQVVSHPGLPGRVAGVHQPTELLQITSSNLC
jgi:hypothetical protein